MKMNARVLASHNETLDIKKGQNAGQKLNKTRLKVVDMGEEVGGDLIQYWIDFLGEYALTESEIGLILRQDVVIDIRLVRPTAGKNGGAFLNVSGGMIMLPDGKDGYDVVQGQGR
jgi:hypothetical protein